MIVVFLLGCSACFVYSQRTATVHEVQPSARDVVHAVWMNGPTYSQKTGGSWPQYGIGAGSTEAQCTVHDDSFTGYTSSGQYCEEASPDLDNDAHLLLYSERLAVVIDAGGISASVGSNTLRNLFPKLGSTTSLPVDASVRQVYDFLAPVTTTAQLQTTCTSGADDTYILGTSQDKFVQMGLVRQGHTVTQFVITALEWQDATSGASMGPCSSFVAVKDPTNTNCNGYANWPCPAAYPVCVGFIQGQSWGKCYSECTASGVPNLWLDVTMWPDSINMELAWDGGYTFLPNDCTGTITLSIATDSGAPHSHTTASIEASGGTAAVFLSSRESDGIVVDGQDVVEAADQVVVTSSTSGATVVQRDGESNGPARRDVFVEVPYDTATCGYNMNCASLGLIFVEIVVTNPHPTSSRTLRLSFSRNFPQKVDASVSSRKPGAEITGLSAQLWDTAASQATGIPMQISKNWHEGATVAYWADYDGYWWTASSFLRLPPDTTIPLSLALNYEVYGGLPAFSHAQLSIVGYSDKWLWQEAALGSSGENMCIDPLGTHTRAFITDVRPKLFDGKWKENVGGGDVLLLFGANGAVQYLKELDPQIHSSGPCLSNASYISVTRDDTIRSSVEISGGRTNDLVRVFVHLRYVAMEDFTFSRLVFFQLGSETYNYHATFEEFVIGGSSTLPAHHARTCTGGSSRASAKMYQGGPFRTALEGSAPWWFAFGPNTDSETLASTDMLVGDRGLVIREFQAKLGGAMQTSPTFSVLCDKIEIGTPAGLTSLIEGDYVDMKLEILVLPRAGEEYTYAKNNIGSTTLNEKLNNLPTTWQRVQAQAIGGQLTVIPIVATRVESHYPIRVVATNSPASSFVKFEVKGSALGFVPVVICGLASHLVPAGHGLWMKTSSSTHFTLLDQSSGNDFWQTNYDRSVGTYEIVYNVEIFEDATMAFGSAEDLTTSTTTALVTTTTALVTTLAPSSTSSPTSTTFSLAPTSEPSSTLASTSAPTTSLLASTATTLVSTSTSSSTSSPTSATSRIAPTSEPSSTSASISSTTLTLTTTALVTAWAPPSTTSSTARPLSTTTALATTSASSSTSSPTSSTSTLASTSEPLSPSVSTLSTTSLQPASTSPITSLTSTTSTLAPTSAPSSSSASPTTSFLASTTAGLATTPSASSSPSSIASTLTSTSEPSSTSASTLPTTSLPTSTTAELERLSSSYMSLPTSATATFTPTSESSHSPPTSVSYPAMPTLASSSSTTTSATVTTSAPKSECIGQDPRCKNSMHAKCIRLGHDDSSCRWESASFDSVSSGSCVGIDSECHEHDELSCDSLTQAATCKWRADFTYVGSLTLHMSNPASFAEDPKSTIAIKEGLVDLTGVPSDYIDVDLHVVVSSHLQRRLQSDSLIVTHVIEVRSHVPPSVSVTGDDMGEVFKASNIARISKAISSSVHDTFDGEEFGIIVQGVESISLVIASKTRLSSTTTMATIPNTSETEGPVSSAGAAIQALPHFIFFLLAPAISLA